MNYYLSIDGGGAKGASAIKALQYIEQLRKRKLQFKGYAGTSVGALLASLLAKGLLVDEVVEIMDKDLKSAFMKQPWYCKFNIYKPKYQSKGLSELLYKYLGDITFEELPSELTIVACSSRLDKFVVYNKTETPKVLVRDAALHSASAPTYFDPFMKYGTDGGLIANNPVAVLQCQLPIAEDYHIFSMGTGFDLMQTHDLTKFSIVGWGKYLLKTWLTNSGGAMTYIATQHAKRVNEYKGNEDNKVLRIIPPSEIEFEMDDLDKVDEQVALWQDEINSKQEEILSFFNK